MKLSFAVTHRHRLGAYVEKLHNAISVDDTQYQVVYRETDGTVRVASERFFCDNFTKIRKLRVRQYVPGFVDTREPRESAWVETLEDVESVEFVKRWSDNPQFVDFRLGVKDGHEATLIAVVKDEHQQFYVVAFLSCEDYTKDEMLARWRLWNTDEQGNLID